MGNSQNSSSETPVFHSTKPGLAVSESDLTYFRTKKDSRLGEIDELQQNATKEALLRKDITINDPSMLTSDNLRKLKTRVHLKHDALLQIYGFAVNTTPENSSVLSIFFEPFASDAATEFRSRQKKQNFFEEEELHATLVTCIQVLQYLQSHRISHGHLTPSSILMSQDGDIKVVDHALLQQENSLYTQCAQGGESCYIAPELLQLIREDKDISTSGVNTYKSDVFSLGMAFLYAALLEEPTDCYDWETLTFDGRKLLDSYERVRSKYRGPFVNLLQYLLKIEPQDRPDFQSLMLNLEHYQKHDTYIRDPKYSTPVYNETKATERRPSTEHHSIYDQTPEKASYVEETNNTKLSFVDPKVQEIIREAKEKNWIKSGLSTGFKSTYKPADTYNSTYKPADTYNSTYKPADTYNSTYKPADTYSSDYKPAETYSSTYKPVDTYGSAYKPAETYKNTYATEELANGHNKEDDITFRYATAFVDPQRTSYKSPLSNSMYINTSPEELSQGFDHSKYIFNSPRVNEIIAEVRSSTKYTPTDLKGRYSYSTPTKKLFEEKDNSLLSPEKSTLASTSNGFSAKKPRNTQEIIKELRDKYGSKKNIEQKKPLVTSELASPEVNGHPAPDAYEQDDTTEILA